MLIDAGTILGLSESVGTLAMGAPAESEVLAAPGWMALTPFTPLLGVVTCIIAAMSPNLRKTRFPAFATVGSIALGFVLSVITFLSVGDTTQIAHAWDWIHLSWGTDEGETARIDALVEAFEKQGFLCFGQGGGAANVEEEFYATFHLIDVLPATAGAAGGAKTEFGVEDRRIHDAGF